jgi:SET domain-containing protein
MEAVEMGGGAVDPALLTGRSKGERAGSDPMGRIEVRRSPIHGRGVFARRRIREGAYIASFKGVKTKKDGEYVLWTLDEDGNEVGIRGRNELRFLNHSLAPNAEFRGTDLYALRNIQPGSEIMLHYGDDWEGIE